MKRILSVLALLTALALFCGAYAAPAAAAVDAAPAAAAVDTAAYAAEVVRLVNEERAKVGAAPLASSNSKLSAAAQKRAQEAAGYFSHTRPDGTEWETVLPEYGIQFPADYTAWGENLAGGQKTPAEVVQAWMGSEGHKKNILKTSYNWIGVGVYEKDGTLYWSQLFLYSTTLTDDTTPPGDEDPPGGDVDPPGGGFANPFASIWSWIANIWNWILSLFGLFA